MGVAPMIAAGRESGEVASSLAGALDDEEKTEAAKVDGSWPEGAVWEPVEGKEVSCEAETA
jgi:hypothetical protein